MSIFWFVFILMLVIAAAVVITALIILKFLSGSVFSRRRHLPHVVIYRRDKSCDKDD